MAVEDGQKSFGKKTTIWVLFGLLLVALLLRWPWSGMEWQHPDERLYVQYPLGFWSGDLNPHFFHYPTFHFYLVSLLYYLYHLVFGNGTTAQFIAYHYFVDDMPLLGLARSLSGLMGIGTVAVVALLGRQLYGWRGGLIAGGLLALMPLHVRFSYLAAADVPGVFWLSLALLATVRAVQRQSRWDYLLAGVGFALAAASKYHLVLGAVGLGLALWFRPPKPKLMAVMGGAALLSFFLATPYLLLDWRQAWTDLLTMGQVHFLEDKFRVADSSWLHWLRYNLRYGLGLVGLVTAALALAWRPGTWRLEEKVLVASTAAFLLLLLFVSSFMRYALPLAPLLALLMVRPLLGLSRNRLVLGLWLAAILAEPTYASYKTRRLLGSADTRDQAHQWLAQALPNGGRLLHLADRASQVPLLNVDSILGRQQLYARTFGQDQLYHSYRDLSQRQDLPPLYVPFSFDLLQTHIPSTADGAPGRIAVFDYKHQLSHPLPNLETQPALRQVTWQAIFTPGDGTVFDRVDAYFVPIGNWWSTQHSGPQIRVGWLPITLVAPVPQAQQYFGLLYSVWEGSRAVERGDWNMAAQALGRLVQSRFYLEELLSLQQLNSVYQGMGMVHYQKRDLPETIRYWELARRADAADPLTYFNIGTAYSQLNQNAKALPYFEEAAALAKNDADLLYNLGQAYGTLDKLQEARHAFEQALSLKENAATYFGLGLVYKALGDPHRTRFCAEQVARLQPDHPRLAELGQGL